MKQYPTNGIATMHKGVRFRSRLEATWACFFGLCGLQYEYEPFDLPGFIPDFLIKMARHPILADIKPISTDHDFDVRMREVTDLVPSDTSIMVIGVGPMVFPGMKPHIGMFNNLAGVRARAYLKKCMRCGAAGIVLIDLVEESGHPGRAIDGCDCGTGGTPIDTMSAWASAKNEVQWNARRAS